MCHIICALMEASSLVAKEFWTLDLGPMMIQNQKDIHVPISSILVWDFVSFSRFFLLLLLFFVLVILKQNRFILNHNRLLSEI